MKISTFMIEKMIKFIENIKNLSAELKNVSQKNCAYIIASICPLGYLKLMANMQQKSMVHKKKTHIFDPMK